MSKDALLIDNSFSFSKSLPVADDTDEVRSEYSPTEVSS